MAFAPGHPHHARMSHLIVHGGTPLRGRITPSANKNAVLPVLCATLAEESNASVALVHGMSRPIGAHFHVPHGLSNAMLLPAVTRFGLQSALARYAEAGRRVGFASTADSDEVAANKLADGLVRWNSVLAVPTPPGFGIAPAAWDGKLDLMADQALASGSPANNPRVPTKEEIVALYRQVWAANA